MPEATVPQDPSSTFRRSRRRLAAVTVALAATVGIGVAAVTSAQNVQETTTGCRLLDTRSSSQIGTVTGPLGAAETIAVQATGDNGQCTGIPSNAESLDIQITVEGATERTFVTVYDAELPARPLISHLNAGPQVPVSSNTTIVSLSDAGAFQLYNHAGSVDVVIDILGIFQPGDASASFEIESEQPATFVGDTVGVRFKASNGGAEVFLGVNDLGAGTNRSEFATTWVDGLRPFSFTFDGTELTATVAETGQPPGISSTTFTPATTCATPDTLQISLLARANSGDLAAVENLVIDGVAVGDFGPATADPGDYVANVRSFTVSGDFADGFELSGMLDTAGFGANVNENNRIELTVGCSS